MKFNRQQKNFIGEWRWTIDTTSIFAIFLIMLFVAVMVASASPAVAERLGYGSFHFVKRQLAFLFPSVFLLLSCSFLSPVYIKRLAFLGFAAGIVILALMPFISPEINGAKRWL